MKWPFTCGTGRDQDVVGRDQDVDAADGQAEGTKPTDMQATSSQTSVSSDDPSDSGYSSTAASSSPSVNHEGITLTEEGGAMASEEQCGESSMVYVANNDDDTDTPVELGMTLTSVKQGSSYEHSVIIEPNSIAAGMNIQSGWQLWKLNDMDVRRWPHSVLVSQFLIIRTGYIRLLWAEELQRDGHVVCAMRPIAPVNLIFGATVEVEFIEEDISMDPVEVDTAPIEVKYRYPREGCGERIWIQHCNSQDYIHMADGDCHLLTGPLSSSELFIFQNVTYSGIQYEQEQNSNEAVIVFEISGKHSEDRLYITVVDRDHIALQKKERLRCNIKVLDSTDPRFFFQRHIGTNDCLESTECRGSFLACDDKGKIFLKHIPDATDRTLLDDPQVVFKIHYGNAVINEDGGIENVLTFSNTVSTM